MKGLVLISPLRKVNGLKIDISSTYKKLIIYGLHDDFVFIRPDGSPINPGAVTLAFRRITKRAGLKNIRIHDLRHTHATLMLKAGVHPKVVSERLGHANIGITLEIYSHVLPGIQEAMRAIAAKALKSNDILYACRFCKHLWR